MNAVQGGRSAGSPHHELSELVTAESPSSKMPLPNFQGSFQMPDPNTIPVPPGNPEPPGDGTKDWRPTPDAVASADAPATVTRTEASTPGPGHPERRTDSADTERLRDPVETKHGLPDIPGYRVEKEIGHGGMGDVYRAIDLLLAKTVALKVIYPRGRDKQILLGRFEREVQALALIEHPNIVPIYHAGEWRGLPFFTMKFVAGGSLTHNLARFTGNPHACARLVAKVARAIQALHDHDVIHRDLKPLNILLGEGDEPLVADFGLAKWLEDSTSLVADDYPLSISGVPMGTRYYMSPEQTRGAKTDFPKSTDIWAIGVMLYEMLSGKRPFADDGIVDLYVRIREDDPPPLPDSVPPELAAIVLKCLAKNPADRFTSAAAAADHLDAWLAGKPAPQPLPLPKRPRVWRVAAALLAIAALIAVPASLMPRSDPPPQTKKTIAERLNDHETVVLIGPDGMPRFEYRALPGCEENLAKGQSTGFATLTSLHYSAVELSAEDLPWPVKLQAEYAIPKSTMSDSYAGLYVGEKVTPAENPCTTLIQLVHQETHMGPSWLRPKPAVIEKAAFDLMLRQGVKGERQTMSLPVRRDLTEGPALTDQALEWHTVEIVIDSIAVNGAWNSLELTPLFGPTAPNRNKYQCLQHWLPLIAPTIPSRPNFTPPYIGPGIGVCVFNATAVFRNVRLIPLRP
jgi:eukaryotic-like serine/threonine-protein kinase